MLGADTCYHPQALEEAQSKDLIFWASRYHLFVTWSPDRSHPWDSLPAAGQYSTLEVGIERGTSDKVSSNAAMTGALGALAVTRETQSAHDGLS